jgi:TetR/AcrR family transcriptional repressor of nem operon
MRYRQGYKDEKRRTLLQEAGKLVKKNGFAATGIDALMRAAGVTSGTFYSHFSSKAELLKALLSRELESSRQMWAGNREQDIAAWRAQIGRYLSLTHVSHPEAGCILPALAAEIGRADPATRELFEAELVRGQQGLAELLGRSDPAWAIISLQVGAVLLAGAVAGKETQNAILNDCKTFLEDAVAGLSRGKDQRAGKRRLTPGAVSGGIRR